MLSAHSSLSSFFGAADFGAADSLIYTDCASEWCCTPCQQTLTLSHLPLLPLLLLLLLPQLAVLHHQLLLPMLLVYPNTHYKASMNPQVKGASNFEIETQSLTCR